MVDGDWRNRKSLILCLTFTIFEPMGVSHARALNVCEKERIRKLTS